MIERREKFGLKSAILTVNDMWWRHVVMTVSVRLMEQSMDRCLQPGSRLDPLFAAKARVALLPQPHVPRPRVTMALAALVRGRRLVLLSAGALTGKTTALAELAATLAGSRVFWYTVDDVDTSARTMLEGIALAVDARGPAGDDLQLLAAIIHALSAPGDAVLILDDIHRGSGGAAVIDGILRYLPPHARLVLSGRPQALPDVALLRWLEDRGQCGRLGATDLRLDAEEQRRFQAATGRDGQDWAVDYRPGSHPALVDGLRRGVLPAIPADLRSLIDLLAVTSEGSPALLGAALGLSEDEAACRLRTLHDDTLLLTETDGLRYRLRDAVQSAVLSTLGNAAVAALRARAASALLASDPCRAAHLFALAEADTRATDATRNVTWWEWTQRRALALSLGALLTDASLCQAPDLALVVAHQRMAESGIPSVHPFIRALRPSTPLGQMERLRLLSQCCMARGLSWRIPRHIARLEALVQSPPPGMTTLDRGYGLAVLGTVQGFAADNAAAVETLDRGLDLLTLAGGDGSLAAHTRLLALRALAVVHRRQGHLAEAGRVYTLAQEQAITAGSPHMQVELANNRAVLLQQHGHHASSADLLRDALAAPGSGDHDLRAVLLASLADALWAQDDRGGAGQALHSALTEANVSDSYGLAGHIHATRAALLADGGLVIDAATELARGAPPHHPAAYMARALIAEADGRDATPDLRAALDASVHDKPLHMLARAYRARGLARGGDLPSARKLADAIIHDRAYALTAREARILAPCIRRERQPRRQPTRAIALADQVSIQFFGLPALTANGEIVGSAWFGRSKGRELLWYALAHGDRGFTREEACADLYPDLDGMSGSRALRNALYELRKLLHEQCGVAEALADAGGQLRLLPSDLGHSWISDTAVLQDLLGHLRTGALDDAERLPGLLRGQYLSDLSGDWTRPFRYYWEREALHALDLAATGYERAGRFEDALTCLRRAVDLFPDDTALAQRMMGLYHAVGDISGVRATYLQHCRSVREDLGAEPERALVDLYERLTSA